MKKGDKLFYSTLFGLAGISLFAIILLLVADAQYLEWQNIRETLKNPAIQQSIKLTFITCSIATILSLVFAIPTAYLLSRLQFRGKNFIEAIFDIPIVLPPIVVGLSLLVLFNKLPLGTYGGEILTLERIATGFFEFLGFADAGVTYQIPAIILAQLIVAGAFALRSLRATFDELNPRSEAVALTLGCSHFQAFRHVVLPESFRGILSAASLAFARALGEFGPILVFAGATRYKTEVLSTSIFLEMNVGNLKGAITISFLMLSVAMILLYVIRTFSQEKNDD